MSARSDYPILATVEIVGQEAVRLQMAEALDEIDQLRDQVEDLLANQERTMHRIADYWERYESPNR